jgi:hypothetical protein
MQTIKSYLPIFPGFYNTIFEPELDIESELEHWETELGRKVEESELDFDYKEYEETVGERACNFIEETVREFLSDTFTVEFEGIDSPREYNFRNDSINCTFHYEPEDITRMIYLAFSDRNLAAEYLEGKFKSRSGFISFYGFYDLDQWGREYLPKIQNDPVIFASILELAILAHMEETERGLVENMYYYSSDCMFLTSTILGHE